MKSTNLKYIGNGNTSIVFETLKNSALNVFYHEPIEKVSHQKVREYIDYLLEKRHKARTINLHLARIRVFYDYLYNEEEIKKIIGILDQYR